MPRSQNAHAIVNSGFLYKLTPENKVVQARIVFGGLSPSFVRASSTERFLIGKPLFKNETLQAALNVLKAELVVTENPPEESVAYRKNLALGLFYKVRVAFLLLDSIIKHETNYVKAVKLELDYNVFYRVQERLYCINLFEHEAT